MKLVPFQTELYDAIAGWPRDAAEAQAWGGRDTPFPVTEEVLRNWHREPCVQPLAAFEHGELVAYGELWIDREADEIELARIIVKPANRRRGIGRTFVRLLVAKAREEGIDEVYLRVVPENHPALRCYRSARFVPVSAERQELYNRGQPVEYQWLKYTA